MLVYEIALDGELALDLVDLRVPIRRRDSRGTTILVVPRTPADSLSRILVLLGSLGIGVTAVHQREETGPGGGRCSSRCSPGLPRRSGRRSRTVILEEGWHRRPRGRHRRAIGTIPKEAGHECER